MSCLQIAPIVLQKCPLPSNSGALVLVWQILHVCIFLDEGVPLIFEKIKLVFYHSLATQYILEAFAIKHLRERMEFWKYVFH